MGVGKDYDSMGVKEWGQWMEFRPWKELRGRGVPMAATGLKTNMTYPMCQLFC